jgi:hypothetical protein
LLFEGEYTNGECVRVYDLTESKEHETADVHKNEVTASKNSEQDEFERPDPARLFSQPKNNNGGGFANYERGNWHDFLRGSQSPINRRYGKHQTEERCPLVCPPCELARRRRQAQLNSAEIDVRLGTCNVQRDRTVIKIFCKDLST